MVGFCGLNVIPTLESADIGNIRLRALFFLETGRLVLLQQLGRFAGGIVDVTEDTRLGRAGCHAVGLFALGDAVRAEDALLNHTLLADAFVIRTAELVLVGNNRARSLGGFSA